MHPTVLIVAVLLLHGVSGHLFPRALPYKPTKHMQLPKYHTRQSDVDECIDNKIDEAFQENATLEAICKTAAEEADADINDDDDLTQSEINAIFSVLCRPDCGNVYLSAADDCGEFDGDDAPLRDFFIDICGTNQNGDKCYEIYGDAVDALISEEPCFETYFATKVCNCQSALSQDVREQGCCLDIYYDLIEGFQNGTDYKASDFFDGCDVNYPSGCNNSPLGSGFMPQVALVTLISALIFSVLLS